MEGLSKIQAAKRLSLYGPNSMTVSKSRTLLHMIWDQLYNIITVILLVAAIIAGIFQEWIEFGFIIAVVIANVTIGVIQEGKAEAATNAIKNMVSMSAVVLRNKRKVTVDAGNLVIGDIIYLSAGDKIPADVRWFNADNLQVTEAMLTGESAPIGKSCESAAVGAMLGDRTGMGFTGTFCFTGQGIGLVVATGDSAEIGKINQMMTNVEVLKTPLLVQIEGFGMALSIICIFIAILSFLVAYLGRGMDLSNSFQQAVSVAVALIPEGLPTVVTITLALGVQVMAKNNAIIRQLPAVETLGAVTVICSDKTGTLTKNEMTALGVHNSSGSYKITGTGYNPDGYVMDAIGNVVGGESRDKLCQMLLIAALCNDATLMPVVSAHAQTMMQTQPITLSLLSPSSHATSSTSTVPPSDHASNLHATTPQFRAVQASQADHTDILPKLSQPVEAATPQVGSAILTALTMGLRLVQWGTTGDPTEAALLSLVMKAGLNLRTLNELSFLCPRLGTLPFSSENKFMATVHDFRIPVTSLRTVTTSSTTVTTEKHRYILVKGAPDVLLPRCLNQAIGDAPWQVEAMDLNKWLLTNKLLAMEGLRVIALCRKEIPIVDLPKKNNKSNTEGTDGSNMNDDDDDYDPQCQLTVHSSDIITPTPSLTLCALVSIIDPPRDEAIVAVRQCHEAGITVKMITGDHRDTAATIAGWIGIQAPTDKVITGSELEAMSDSQLEDVVEGCHVFARTSPEHKLRIVQALQKHGHVAAMTGDGVNDAPALRQANVGIAMGITGTEVAKEASKMILQDDSFASIAAAVAQGRTTYDNLRKLFMFILPTSVAQGIVIAIAVYVGIPAPLTTIQILYINMITAATLGLVLAAEKTEKDVMHRPPRQQGKPIVGKAIVWRTLFVGGLMIGAMIGQQQWTLAQGGSVHLASTLAMNTLVISQCLYCVSCRFISTTSISLDALIGNPWLTGMIFLNVGLQCLITYVPQLNSVWETEAMNGFDWLRVLGFSVFIFIMVELEKRFGGPIVRPCILPAIRKLLDLMSCACCKNKIRRVQPYRFDNEEVRLAVETAAIINDSKAQEMAAGIGNPRHA